DSHKQPRASRAASPTLSSNCTAKDRGQRQSRLSETRVTTTYLHQSRSRRSACVVSTAPESAFPKLPAQTLCKRSDKDETGIASETHQHNQEPIELTAKADHV